MSSYDRWKEYGLTPKGAKKAEKAMPHMLKALKIGGVAVAAAVFHEALFQEYELPRRSKEFQDAHKWTPAKQVRKKKKVTP